jgi:hypothetical protein
VISRVRTTERAANAGNLMNDATRTFRVGSQKSLALLSIPLLIAVTLVQIHPVAALGVVDQSYNPGFGGAGWNWVNLQMPIGQSFAPTGSSLVGVDVGIENVLVMDQSYNLGFGGAGWHWINAYTPIGQSFMPTMSLLGGVDVGIYNAVTLDQSFDPGFGAGWNWVQAHQPIGQSFTPTYPRLWEVDLGLENPSAGSVSLTLNIRKGTISGPVVGSQIFTVPVTGPKFVSVYFTPYPGVTLTPGMTYVLDLVGSGPATVRWYTQIPGGTYPSGTAITDGSQQLNGDYLFKTNGFGDTITMNIRAGTVAGPIVGSSTLPIPPMDTPIMMYFNLTTPVPVTVGATYTIELQQSPQSVRWYFMSPGGYPGGAATNSGTLDLNSDYLFDTYGAGDSLTINIREGSIAGPILTTVTEMVPLTAPTLFHVDFPSAVPLTPGSPYVIELQQYVQSIRWYTIDPRGAYLGGTAINNGGIAPAGDYIFQTYAASGPTSTSLSISFTPSTIDIGTSPPGEGNITATITPTVSGFQIFIFFSNLSLGPWTFIGSGTTDASGNYTVTWLPSATGTYFVRADFMGDSSYAASTVTSSPSSIVVVPEFPPTAASMLVVFAIVVFEMLLRGSIKAHNAPNNDRSSGTEWFTSTSSMGHPEQDDCI